jgi:hypothetical protein
MRKHKLKIVEKGGLFFYSFVDYEEILVSECGYRSDGAAITAFLKEQKQKINKIKELNKLKALMEYGYDE